jgi:hypothetical protein
MFSTVLFDNSSSAASKLVKVFSFTTAAEYTREKSVRAISTAKVNIYQLS